MPYVHERNWCLQSLRVEFRNVETEDQDSWLTERFNTLQVLDKDVLRRHTLRGNR